MSNNNQDDKDSPEEEVAVAVPSEESYNYKIGGLYSIVEQIGSGSFGKVFLAEDKIGRKYAVKLESAEVRRPRLYKEGEIYGHICGLLRVPYVFWIGPTEDLKYNALVLEILGPSLSDLFERCSKRFTLKTVLLLAEQLINSVEALHRRGYCHRDVKPSNFLMGSGARDHMVFMIDFGLSEKFREEDNTTHVPNLPRQGVGTPLFASARLHQNNTPSRRDDMESLSYMLIYFLKGALPWGGINCKRMPTTWKRVAEKKLAIEVEDLCEDIPPEFATFLNYCRSLEYEEEPNYQFARVLFRVLAKKMEYLYDFHYDWVGKGHFVITDSSTDDDDDDDDDEDDESVSSLSSDEIVDEIKNGKLVEVKLDVTVKVTADPVGGVQAV